MTGRRQTHVCSPEKHCDVCDADALIRRLSYLMLLLERGKLTAYETHALVYQRTVACGCGGCA